MSWISQGQERKEELSGREEDRETTASTRASPIADWFLESFFLKYFFQEKTYHGSDLGRKKKSDVKQTSIKALL